MIIIIDSREQTPWHLSKYNGVEREYFKCIKCGDYQIEGSNQIIIERKNSPSELSKNLYRHYKRFCRELKKMEEYKEKYILMEFSLEDLLSYPKNTNIKTKITGKFLLKRMEELEQKYNIKFIFGQTRIKAEEIALELLLRAYEKNQKRN